MMNKHHLIGKLSKMQPLNRAKMDTFKWFHLITQLSLIGLLSWPAVGLEISLPQRCRTEGRITLNYPNEGQDGISKYNLAFTESMDNYDLRSVVSIGYVGYDPVQYYTRQDSLTITVNSNGVCQPLDHATYFVSEINWFVEKVLNIPMAQFSADSPHMVGPTGLFGAINGINSDDYVFARAVTYRNIACNVHSKTVRLPGKPTSVTIELYSPAQGTLFRNLKTTYFSIQFLIVNSKEENGHEKASFIIDYYNIDNFADDTDRFESILKKDFNIPINKGCSKYLMHVKPRNLQTQVSLNYKQRSSGDSYLLAYDQSAGYMRKELLGKSVNIWDFNEELVYHVSNNAPELLLLHLAKSGDIRTCSVLHVNDRKLAPTYRPYEFTGAMLDILKLLGASNIVYMGRGSVRDLPCRIYETILEQAPNIFGLAAQKREFLDNGKFAPLDVEYIVQFYLLQGQQDTGKSKEREEFQTDIDFWPAQIVLNKREKSSGSVEFVDQLDIYDFYWSLDGWDKKASQLFMAPECFDDDDEQLRLEMALTFDRFHKGVVKAEDKALLPYNKFKLEFELINEVFGLFQISKLHLVEYELKLSPNHVNLDLVIGDRQEYKNLVYVGEGRLPNEDSYKSNRLQLKGLDEESCVLLSSLVGDISMVVHCESSDKTSLCTAVYDQNEPLVEFDTDTKPSLTDPACRVFWYTSAGIPKRGTEIVLQKSAGLHKRAFEFVAKSPDGIRSETLHGEVSHYDVSREIQLININNYKFAIDDTAPTNQSSHDVRSLDTVLYKSEGDCARMCNLDMNCRSYSYCSYNKEQPCLLSRLDLRASKVREQLVHSSSPTQENNRVAITGDDGSKYELVLLDHCDIYERNYLNMFRQTDEIIRLDASLANRYQTAETTFECAKQSVDLESKAQHHNYHVSMFAYCATKNTCLMDQNLFSITNGDNNNDAKEDELLCRIYRKKYQTYFQVSAEVLVPDVEKQVASIEHFTVEECARACWVKFGQVCASFDYCSPKSCIINQIGTQSGDAKLEIRTGCLHYERDLELEELRKSHLKMPGEFLDSPRGGSKFLDWLVNIISFVLVSGAFIYGLDLGRQLNDKIEGSSGPSGRRRSSLPAAAARARPARRETLFGFKRFSTFGATRNSIAAGMQVRHHDDAQLDSGNAINLEVINKSADTDREPLEGDF